jgi:hypothetical protein
MSVTDTHRLPPPIKPRTLVRRKTYGGFDYTTSDGRYEISPQYAENRLGGYTPRIERYRVLDTTTNKSAYWPRLEDVRWLYCTPIAKMPWLVYDVDDGVLRVEPSRQAAVDWASSFADAAKIMERHEYSTGHYEYVFADSDGDICGNFIIVRADVAHVAHIDAVQPPVYPFPDDPFEEVDRPEPKAEEAA